MRGTVISVTVDFHLQTLTITWRTYRFEIDQNSKCFGHGGGWWRTERFLMVDERRRMLNVSCITGTLARKA